MTRTHATSSRRTGAGRCGPKKRTKTAKVFWPSSVTLHIVLRHNNARLRAVALHTSNAAGCARTGAATTPRRLSTRARARPDRACRTAREGSAPRQLAGQRRAPWVVDSSSQQGGHSTRDPARLLVHFTSVHYSVLRAKPLSTTAGSKQESAFQKVHSFHHCGCTRCSSAISTVWSA